VSRRSLNGTKSLVEPIGRLVVAKKLKAKVKAKKSKKAKRAAVARKNKGMTKSKPAKKAKFKKRAHKPTAVPLAPTPLDSASPTFGGKTEGQEIPTPRPHIARPAGIKAFERL